MSRITAADVREMIQLVRDVHRTIHPIQSAAVGVSLDWLETVRGGLIDLAAQMEADAEAMAGKVLVPREIAQWTHDLLKRRLNLGEKGEWLEPWRDSDLGKRDQQWVDALAQGLGDSDEGYPACEALAEAGLTREDVAQALVEVRAKAKEGLR